MTLAPEDEVQSATASGLTLRARVTLTQADITIGYTVHNASPYQVALFNRLEPDTPEPGWRHCADLAYIDYLDGEVFVDQLVPATSAKRGHYVEEVPMPAVTLLSANETRSEKVTLSLPLIVWQPIRHRAMVATASTSHVCHVTPTRSCSAARIVYRLGAAKVALPTSPKRIEDGPPVVYDPPLLEGRQIVLSVSFNVSPISVLDYETVA